MTDEVITISKVTYPLTIHNAKESAMALKLAGASHNGKVSAEDVENLIFDRLKTQGIADFMKKACGSGNIMRVTNYADDLRQGAVIAVGMGLASEVVVPDVPNFCAAALRKL